MLTSTISTLNRIKTMYIHRICTGTSRLMTLNLNLIAYRRLTNAMLHRAPLFQIISFVPECHHIIDTTHQWPYSHVGVTILSYLLAICTSGCPFHVKSIPVYRSKKYTQYSDGF
eukprot:266376_1